MSFLISEKRASNLDQGTNSASAGRPNKFKSPHPCPKITYLYANYNHYHGLCNLSKHMDNARKQTHEKQYVNQKVILNIQHPVRFNIIIQNCPKRRRLHERRN
jgi:hypothetical protein